jgi:branched-chain amino acid transport system ATP-binding protein
MTDILLEVRDLVSGYGESQVLNQISFDLLRGETLTLLGRNGVGKTTTLRTLMGMISATSGSIRFDGRDLTTLNSIQRARLGIGIVPEDRGIFSSLSVEENLLLPPIIFDGGLSLPEIYKLFPNLEERRSSPGTKLSGGEQQMLAIARVLRTGARLILLDEPTEGLAPVIIQRIGEVLRVIRKRGITVILVEQNFRWARRVSDRFLLMDGGQITGEVAVADVDAKRQQINEALTV